MLYENFNNLDSDYITLKSRFLLTEKRDEYLKGIEILAEKGQVNAIQDFYFFKKNEQANSKINQAALQLSQKPFPNMEELYAVGLFYEHAQFSTVEEKREIMTKCKTVFKNDKARRLSAQKLYYEAITQGKKEMMDCLWGGAYKNGMVCERLAQICIFTGFLAGAYETANGFAKENLKKTYLKVKDDEAITFLYSMNTLRNHATSHYCEQELEALAARKLSIQEELDNTEAE